MAQRLLSWNEELGQWGNPPDAEIKMSFIGPGGGTVMRQVGKAKNIPKDSPIVALSRASSLWHRGDKLAAREKLRDTPGIGPDILERGVSQNTLDQISTAVTAPGHPPDPREEPLDKMAQQSPSSGGQNTSQTEPAGAQEPDPSTSNDGTSAVVEATDAPTDTSRPGDGGGGGISPTTGVVVAGVALIGLWAVGGG